MTTKKAQFECPECHQNFDYAKTLGSHRRNAHGVLGTSKSALNAQAKRAEDPLPTGPWLCKDCDFEAESKAGLTIHRKMKHGAVSESATAVKIRASDPMQCVDCDFYATTKGGLALHRLKKHGEVSHRRNTELKRIERLKQKGLPIAPTQTITAVAITSNGHQPQQEAHFATNGIPESTLALALGRFQELCRSIATEHDLPPRSFAAQHCKLIYATTLR